jgi:hypothetical protein
MRLKRFGNVVINLDTISFVVSEEERTRINFVGGGTYEVRGAAEQEFKRWLEEAISEEEKSKQRSGHARFVDEEGL